MPLSGLSILVLAQDAEHATNVVRAIDRAHGDTVIAAYAHEALERLGQFTFDLAVIDCSPGADAVVTRLEREGVPYCVCGGVPPPSWNPLMVIAINELAEISRVVAEVREGKGGGH